VQEVVPRQVALKFIFADAALNAHRAGPSFVCRHCGRALTVVETLLRGQTIRAPPAAAKAP